MTLELGMRLGPYEVVSQLRFAGLGEIYQGRDHEHGRDVAIRVVRLDAGSDPGLLQQLAGDVMDTAALSHPSIPRIYEVGTAADTLYIVSEPFDGATLRTLLDGGPLSTEAASACIAQIEGALAVASAQGVSHGDLRADNVLLTWDRRTLVLGFGLAAAVGGDGPSDAAALDALRDELLPPDAAVLEAPPTEPVPVPHATSPRPWWRRSALAIVGLVVLALGIGAFVTLSIQRARLNVQASRTGAEGAPTRNGSTAIVQELPSDAADVGGAEERPAVGVTDEALAPLEEAAEPSAVASDPPDTAPSDEEPAESDTQASVDDGVARIVEPLVAEAEAVAEEAPEPEAVVAEAPLPPPSVPPPTVPQPVAGATPTGPVPGADGRDARSLVAEAMVRAAEFDLPGAMELLSTAAVRGDAGSEVGLVYLRGLVDAREAFRAGGTADSLAPVFAAIEGLGAISQGRRGSAEIARLVLQASAAAAQTERDEMRLYLETAMQMELIQNAAGLPGAPLVSATEIAGDLWLQVDRYEDARRVYADAADRVGPSLRIMVGHARASSRLNDVPAACASYGGLLDTWSSRPGLPPEVEEARTYVEEVCETASSTSDQTPN
ncbi:MAG: protein kinase [Acidobacteria bacterium]|nr:protein kinase [Acidobacteriota bacterium]